jgi:predicted acetyltransferase
MLELVLPSEEYRDSFLAALAEIRDNPIESRVYQDEIAVSTETFAAYLAHLARDRTMPQPGRVPQTQYWVVEGKQFLGRVNVRHHLNAVLSAPGGGGHIGYLIRPSVRRAGIGGVVLAQALAKAMELGLDEVVLSCNNENIPSWKIIEKNGGVLQGVYELSPGVFERRYLINTCQAKIP